MKEVCVATENSIFTLEYDYELEEHEAIELTIDVDTLQQSIAPIDPIEWPSLFNKDIEYKITELKHGSKKQRIIVRMIHLDGYVGSNVEIDVLVSEIMQCVKNAIILTIYKNGNRERERCTTVLVFTAIIFLFMGMYLSTSRLLVQSIEGY